MANTSSIFYTFILLFYLLYRDVIVQPTVQKCIYGVSSADSDHIRLLQHKFDVMMTGYLTLTYSGHQSGVVSLGILFDDLEHSLRV